MPQYIVPFNFSIESLNSSLQVGDIIYYVPTINPTASNTYDIGDLSNVQEYGTLIAIDETFIPPGFTLTIDSSLPTPTILNYLMFAKEKKANTSSLLGYYADVKFINNSKGKAELFSLGYEVTESSK